MSHNTVKEIFLVENNTDKYVVIVDGIGCLCEKDEMEKIYEVLESYDCIEDSPHGSWVCHPPKSKYLSIFEPQPKLTLASENNLKADVLNYVRVRQSRSKAWRQDTSRENVVTEWARHILFASFAGLYEVDKQKIKREIMEFRGWVK